MEIEKFNYPTRISQGNTWGLELCELANCMIGSRACFSCKNFINGNKVEKWIQCAEIESVKKAIEKKQ